MNPVLFTPLKLGEVTAANRIAVPPMCMYSAKIGVAQPFHLAHYARLAQSGAGLVCIEACAVTPEGRITNLKYESKIDGEQNVFANIYVMKRSLLRNLIMDSLASNYTHFTTDLLVTNLKAMRVMGFEHKGYFAAITSLQSYYERNMDLLDEKHRHELFGDRSVFTKIRDSVPTKYGACAVVKNSLIADGCLIEGTVENSVIFRGVKVARGSVVKNCILMQNTVLGENVAMNCMITDKDVVVRDMRVLSGSENHPFYVPKGTMI